jgi:hypothetical protein
MRPAGLCRRAAVFLRRVRQPVWRVGALRTALLERLRRGIRGIQVNGGFQTRISGTAWTLRIGIGRFTSPADIDYAAAVLSVAHAACEAAPPDTMSKA